MNRTVKYLVTALIVLLFSDYGCCEMLTCDAYTVNIPTHFTMLVDGEVVTTEYMIDEETGRAIVLDLTPYEDGQPHVIQNVRGCTTGGCGKPSFTKNSSIGFNENFTYIYNQSKQPAVINSRPISIGGKVMEVQ